MITGQVQPSIESDRRILSVPAEVIPFRSGVTGGLLAGAVMAGLMAIWGAATGHGIWYPVNLIATTLMPGMQTASPATLAQFSPAGVVIGSALHFGLAALVGLLFVALSPTLPGSPLLWSLVVGPLLWLLGEYLTLPAFNPAMQGLVDSSSFFICHVAYSLILGWWLSRAQKAPAG